MTATLSAPTVTDVENYLEDAGLAGTWETVAIESALAAEAADQQARCRFSFDEAGLPLYNAALKEALCRRVAHNLAVRALPLGVQATVTDAAALTTFVGGTDAEVKRLEGPYRRRWVVG